jgi:hypothetical protein
MDFDITGQLLITKSAFVKYLRKNGNTMRLRISYSQALRKPTIQLLERSCIIFSLSLASP